MKYILTGTQMQQADKYTIEHIGIPSMVLMERAALKVVETMEHERLDFSKVLVACGTGNNGGDGYAIARLLHLKGYQVYIYSVGDDKKRSEENCHQKKITEYYGISVLENINADEYTLIIDAIFGIGLKRNIEGEYKDCIEKLNTLSGYKVAIDIPSGIHDSTGDVQGVAYRADLTVSLAYAKRGQLIYAGHPYVGKLCVVDIGISEDSIPFYEPISKCYDFDDLRNLYPKRTEQSHKGTYGKVLLIVGSKGMSGAASLCAKASYLTGCGLVRIYTHEDNREILQKLIPEAMVTTYDEYNYNQLEELLNWADVVGIGCGLGTSETATFITKQVLKMESVPCVIDADALNIIATNMDLLEKSTQTRIITPHLKEMTRLLNCTTHEIKENRFEQLQSFCTKYKLVCALKDARTVVYQQGEDFFLNLSGNSSMAKGGSGDVLTGVIAGILAQTKNAYKSACLGVYLHGLAGELAAEKKGKYSVLAGDIADCIGEILKQV